MYFGTRTATNDDFHYQLICLFSAMAKGLARSVCHLPVTEISEQQQEFLLPSFMVPR